MSEYSFDETFHKPKTALAENSTSFCLPLTKLLHFAKTKERETELKSWKTKQEESCPESFGELREKEEKEIAF